MAFVFRSQLGKEKPVKTEDFLHTNEKIEKEYLDYKYTKNNKENIINNHKQNPNINLAFFSSSKKEPSYFYSEKNPGPGSYNPKSPNKRQTLDNINEDQLNDDNNNNEKNKLFISREKRFKNNDYSRNLPGPGNYYKDLSLYQKKYLTPQKEAGVLYKKKKYFVNSAKRKITIPSKENNFGYLIDKEGEIKLEKDPNKNIKFNGTYKSSVGPGYYYIENYYSKKNNAHDWSKDKEENNDNEKNKEIFNIYESKLAIQTESNNLKDYYKISPPNKVSTLNTISYNTENKKERKIKNIITKKKNIFPNIPIKFKIEEEILSKIKEKLFKKSYIKESDVPGPGEYKLIDEFDIIANNKQNKNFGSNKNRGLLFSKEKNVIKLGLNNNNIYNSIINTEENRIIKDNNIKLLDNKIKNQAIQQLILLKVKGIKDDYINNKNEVDSRRGPGTYNLNTHKKIFLNDVQNFGSLSKRFDLESNDISANNENKANTLVISEDYKDKKEKKEKKENLHFKSQIPKNILKRNVNGISFTNIKNNKNSIINENRKIPPVGAYSPEKKLSIEHEAKILMKLNERSPGFGEGEKRFYEKENNENENLGAGSYNILPPEKKFTQRKFPFIFSIEKSGRGSILDNHLIKSNLGPGIYKYNDKNDWNKKSFNKLFS